MLTPATVLVLVGAALAVWPGAEDGVGRLRRWTSGGVAVPVVGRPAVLDRLVAHRRAVAVVSGALGLGAALPSGVPVAVVAAGAAVAVVSALLGRVARRRREDRDRQVEEAVAAAADELAAGRNPAEGFRAAATVAGEDTRGGGPLTAAARAVELGGDAAAALAGGGDEVAARLAATWRLSVRSGCPMAPALRTLADDLAARRRLAEQLRVLLAGPRASAALLAALPLFGLLLGTAVGARPWHMLTQTGVGGVLLVVGAVFTAIGLWWTSALVRRAGRSV